MLNTKEAPMPPESTAVLATNPDARDRALVRIVIAGHVDHGKSTLVGRLLHDTDSLPEGKVDALAASAAKRGMPFEWAFLMDASQAERDQGVTIDTAQIWFNTALRDYVIIDAPGHVEFLKNMVTGASQADAAVLVVDAGEGVAEQSRRHAFMLSLLGIERVIVAVNKMDLVDYAQKRFAEIETAIRAHLASLNITPLAVIPIAAREGLNVAGRSDAERTPWYQGPHLVAALDALPAARLPSQQQLRLPIQDVYKFDDRRIFAGRIETGQIRAGDQLIFQPSGKKARVTRIENWPTPWPSDKSFGAGASIGVTLDQPLFLERGEVAAHEGHAPMATDRFKATVFWLGGRPLVRGRPIQFKIGSAESPAIVEQIESVIETSTLATLAVEEVQRNQASEIILRLRKKLALDSFQDGARTGRFVLVDEGVIAGGGLIRSLEAPVTDNLTPTETHVSRAERERRVGHRGGVIWLTGLSGSGKSTVAGLAERALFDRGWAVLRLDGDDLRMGLNKGLTFAPEDRAENIRRAAEVAGLIARTGVIVITSFISPLETDRQRARAIIGDGFREVFVSTSIEVCESRDPKGLYRRARAGEIPQFTGVSAPYEIPHSADLVVPAGERKLEECVDLLVGYATEAFSLGRDTVSL